MTPVINSRHPDELEGRAAVRVVREHGREHRIHVRLEGLPGWLLGMIERAAPLQFDSCGSRLEVQGPEWLSLRGSLVFVAAEPTSPTSEAPLASADTKTGGTP